MKLYTSLDAYGGYPFNIQWPDVKPVYLPSDLEKEPGILVLWGGEDISPSIYGEKVSRYTGADDRPSSRDQLELDLAYKAIALGYPIIAICRGAQLMCAVNGGTVIQHVENHGRSHAIVTNDKREFVTTSLHHQMMNPFKIEHEMVAWSKKYLSPCYIGENNFDIEPRPPVEPEVVYFPQSKTIAIQGHPEFIQSPNNPYVQYCLELTRKYCGG
ncbi:MAG: gamma-glutamyl-gamma-aminobutyrate hydrolase family protein [Candidatus Berkelbacteria bacterium]|nr:gamma-glutamyl-gamma-aminobutyrate hydrolase family protein [Candidatus Berkelbacteria bacterium]